MRIAAGEYGLGNAWGSVAQVSLLIGSRLKAKICLVVSSPMTVTTFLRQPIRQLGEEYEIYVAVNLRLGESLPVLEDAVTVLPVSIERKISPWRDLLALMQMIRLFRRYRFEIVHSVTPKAGLIAMAASFLSGIEIRIHTFTGQVWATRSGAARLVLKNVDRLIALLATHVLVDSASQRQFLLDEGVVAAGKSSVLAKGSISGVDTVRFRPNPEARSRIRHELGISGEDMVFLFLGRLNRDKGILDLAMAFAGIAGENLRAHLLLVGPDEENMRPAILNLTASCAGQVHFVDFATRPEDYLAAADVLCLPSYREGFGNVIIEAAAVGIPAIASRIYGVVDAVEENRTGLLYPARDIGALRAHLAELASAPALRLELGRQARLRAAAEFSGEKLAAAWLEYYRTLR